MTRDEMLDTSVDLDRYIDRLLQQLGLSKDELARALEVSPRSIDRWRTGKSFPQYESRARLEELTILTDRLVDVFDGVDAIQHWLRQPHVETDENPLVDAITSDRFELVERALRQELARSSVA